MGRGHTNKTGTHMVHGTGQTGVRRESTVAKVVCICRVEGRSYTQYARGHYDKAEACESLPDSLSVSSPAGVTTAGGAPAKRGPPEKRGDPPRGDIP